MCRKEKKDYNIRIKTKSGTNEQNKTKKKRENNKNTKNDSAIFDDIIARRTSQSAEMGKNKWS
jgi:hypothetical protein